MAIITKESLNAKDPFGHGVYLKCDIPIWEEFAIGLDEDGGWATNNNFKGVRSIFGQVPNTRTYKDIIIATHNPKSRKFLEFMKDGYTKRRANSYVNLKVTEYERLDKTVCVIEFEYAKE